MSTKVYISWSGDLSNRLAEAVRQWLPGVLQFVKPYFTPSDIEKGIKWGSDILTELGGSDIGIICLTKDNLKKPWILFEAGALSKNFDKSHVCTLLFNVEPTDLIGPLTLFQATKFSKDDFEKLIKTINNCGGETKLNNDTLDNVFGMWWPILEENIMKILKEEEERSQHEVVEHRSERDILEEILELTRINSRKRRSYRTPQRELDYLSPHNFITALSELLHHAKSMARQGKFPEANEFLDKIDLILAREQGRINAIQNVMEIRRNIVANISPTHIKNERDNNTINVMRNGDNEKIHNEDK